MKNPRQCLIWLFLFLGGLLFSRTMDQGEILEKTGARLLWDPVSQKGMFLKGPKSLLFFANKPYLLFNGREMHHDGALVYEKGTLRFSEDTARKIILFFDDRSPAPGKDRDFRVSAIILDPGHGGRDSGANSNFEVDGLAVPLQEKNLVLEMTLDLEERLKERYPHKKIIMTRANDSYPTLEDRVSLANSYEAGEGEGIIYISLHANASLNHKARGFEVWYLPEDYRRQILDGQTGEKDGLQPVLNTLLEEEFTLESKLLARNILDELACAIGDQSPNRGLKEESWFVVRNAKMASVLVETGFLSNQEEAALLRTPEYLKKIGDGIYNGITAFVNFFESR